MLPLTLLTAAIAKSEYEFRREIGANPVDPSKHHLGYYVNKTTSSPSSGNRARAMVCLHGYPNNSAIYDNTIRELMSRKAPGTDAPPFSKIVNCEMPYCRRAPGFETPSALAPNTTIDLTRASLPPNRAWGFTLEELSILFLATINKALGGEGDCDVTVMAHDWGCVTTYLALLRIAKNVADNKEKKTMGTTLAPNLNLERLILLDVGWLGPRAKLGNLLYTVSYQVPLNVWFLLPPSLGGNALTHAQMVFQGNAQRRDPSLALESTQNYFYRSALRDVATKGPLTRLDTELGPALLALGRPALFIYGNDRPPHAHFCDEEWFETVRRTKPGESKCTGMVGGHWMMLDNFEEFFGEVWRFVVGVASGGGKL